MSWRKELNKTKTRAGLNYDAKYLPSFRDFAELEKYIEERIKKVTPYIGPNGNWWIDGVDTGKS